MTAVIAAMLMSQDQLPAGSNLMSAAMARYYKSQSMVATINSQVKSGNTTVSFQTNLQFDRPNLFYLKQTKTISGPVDSRSPNKAKTALIIADGMQVSYDDPNEERRVRGVRQYEAAFFADGSPYNTSTYYTISKACLLQESIPLDFMIADKETLIQLRERLLSCETTARTTVDGKTAYVVQGDFNDYPLRGKYKATLDEEGNLYEMTMVSDVQGLTPEERRVAGQITLTYQIKAAVNAPTDKSLYRLPKS